MRDTMQLVSGLSDYRELVNKFPGVRNRYQALSAEVRCSRGRRGGALGTHGVKLIGKLAYLVRLSLSIIRSRAPPFFSNLLLVKYQHRRRLRGEKTIQKFCFRRRNPMDEPTFQTRMG